MKKFFNETDWMKIMELKDVQEKHNFFLTIYEQKLRNTFYLIK